MGSASSVSTNKVAPSFREKEKNILRLMMPVYFIPIDMTDDDMMVVKLSWDMISSDTAYQYINLKEKNNKFHYNSCILYFHDLFYKRFFDIHPLVKSLYADGLKYLGQLLVRVLTLTIRHWEEPAKCEKAFHKYACAHYKMDLNVVEYGIIGEALFWSLQVVLGTDLYDDGMHRAWVKLYSRMLRTAVPITLAIELKNKKQKQQKERNVILPISNSNSTPAVNLALTRENMLSDHAAKEFFNSLSDKVSDKTKRQALSGGGKNADNTRTARVNQ